MLFGKKNSLVGLDIGSHSVKVVELEAQSNKTYKLINWGVSQPLAEAIVDGEIMDRQLVTDAISNLLESRGIKARSVVAAVSGRAVIVKKIIMNKLSPDDAQQAIYWEAEQHVPYDINDVSLDFEILGAAPNDPKQMQVLLVAAKKDMVISFSDLIREAGLTPTIVDVDSFAAQNAIEVNYDFAPEEVVAILNVGSEMTNINIIQAGVPYFTKDLQVGGNTFTEAVQRKFNLSQSEAAAAVRGESGPGLEVTPVHRAGLRRRRHRARTRAGLPAHRRRGGRDQPHHALRRQRADAGSYRIPRTAASACRPRSSTRSSACSTTRALFAGQDVMKVAPLLTVGIGLALRRQGDKK